MAKNIYKVDVKTSMKEIVQKMTKLKISAFLVTRGGETVGIITSEDMLQLLGQLLEDEKEGLTFLDDFLTSIGIKDALKNPNIV